MSDRMTKKELKAPDAFQKVGADAVPWLIQHQKTVATGVVALVVVGGGVAFANYLGGRGEQRASLQFGEAMRPMSREVNANPPAKPEAGKDLPFKSEQEKDEAVARSLAEFRSQHQGSRAAANAALPLGQVLLRQGKAKEAAPLFDEYLKRSAVDDPLRPTALEAKGYAHEASGELDQALAAFDQLAKETQSDFLKGMGLYHRGRVLLLQGKTDEGVKQLQEVNQVAPNSAASRLATDRLGVLAAQGVTIPEVAPVVPKADAG